MTDADAAITEFLRKADAAYEEYEQGYADADATLRRLESHVEELRDAASEWVSSRVNPVRAAHTGMTEFSSRVEQVSISGIREVFEAADAGIEAAIQPGGSVNDEDLIDAADDHDMAMAFTGQRAFKH